MDTVQGRGEQTVTALIEEGGGVFLEQGPETTRGAAALEALKRQADMRALLDRIGQEVRRTGAVHRGSFRDAIRGEWTTWDRLIKAVRAGVQNDALVYGRAKWPEVVSELEKVAALRKGRGSVDDDEGTVLRNSLTFTQKIMVCLRRVAEDEDLDLDDRLGNDARCVRFLKKVGTNVEKEDVSDPNRIRLLHLETIRLMELKASEGSSLRAAAVREGRELLSWLDEQPSIEGKMRVPKCGEGMNLAQLTAALATKLVTRGAEEKTITKSVGVNSRQAKRIVRDAERKSREGAPTGGKRGIFTKRELLERGEIQGRLELATDRASGNDGLAMWIGRTDELLVRVSAQEVRFVTTDEEEAKAVVAWLSEKYGPGQKDLEVLVTRKDDDFLSEGFVHAIRKTLGMSESQVRMAAFSWKADADRIAKARGQIVMCIEVANPEATGRIRGMYKLAKTMCKARDLTPTSVMQIEQRAWQAVVSAMTKGREQPQGDSQTGG